VENGLDTEAPTIHLKTRRRACNEEHTQIGRRNHRAELFEETSVKSENLYLVRRRDMLQLLRDVCQTFAPANTMAQRPKQTEPSTTTFLRWTNDSLWIARPADWAEAVDLVGSELQVVFAHSGMHYAFKTQVMQQMTHSDHEHGPINALQLNIPLRLGRVDCRGTDRMPVPVGLNLRATVTPTSGRRESWPLHIKDISWTGVGGMLPIGAEASLERNSVFWLEIPLEGDDQPMGFMVRLCHVSPDDVAEQLKTGWSLCPSDDATATERHVRRLREYLSDQAQLVA
jgi:hypothetical protein